MRKTAIYKDDLFLLHNADLNHIESPDRIKVVYEAIGKTEGDFLTFPPFTPASEKDILLNHSSSLLKQIAQTKGKKNSFIDGDTQASAHSYEAALLAVGALIDGVKRIDKREVDNGFCLVRPPGHHAEHDKSMGFCLFNNVAVAAKWARKELGVEKIMIVDWDLHHGNGTQKSFFNTDKVLFCSIHQFPCYPGTGTLLEVGAGKGEGYTVNIPLPAAQDDFVYSSIFNELITPIAKQYEPEFIFVSCGFDTYKDDPLGGMKISGKGFAYMTKVMQDLADLLCGGKLLLTLEGGYSLTGMKEGSLSVISELVKSDEIGFSLSGEDINLFQKKKKDCYPLEQAISIHSNYWNILK